MPQAVRRSGVQKWEVCVYTDDSCGMRWWATTSSLFLVEMRVELNI